MVHPDETFLTRAVCTVFSAFAHVGIFGVFVIAGHRAPADFGTNGAVAPHGAIEVGLIGAEPATGAASPGSGAVAAPSHVGAPAHGHAATRGVTDSPMHTIGSTRPRAGDWVGTYLCQKQTHAVALHIEHVRGDSFRILGNFTSPTGLHGMYAQHGVLDAAGDAKFLPDGWVGPAVPGYIIVGMHGRFDGDTFSGLIDDSDCGVISLHRQTS